MHAAIFLPVFAAAALAQSGSSSPSVDAFPQTSFLAQTNSLGVVTGQPPVATSIPSMAPPNLSQPAAVTTQPPPANIPALGTGVHTVIQGIPGTNQTSTLVVSIGSNTTSIVAPTPSGPSGSGSGPVTGTAASGSNAASGATASTTSSQGAGATIQAMAGGLVGAGALMAAFL